MKRNKKVSYLLLAVLLLMTLPVMLYVAWSQRPQYTGADASEDRINGSPTFPYTPFSWQTKAPYPLRLSEAQGFMHQGKLYVFGGFNGYYINSQGRNTLKAVPDSYALDTATNTWTKLANMPVALTHSPFAIDGDTVYFVGGFDGDHPGPSTDVVLKYSLANDTWSYGPSLPEKRGSGAAAIVCRELHYIGGTLRQNGDEYIDKSDHWVLNLDNPAAWETTQRAPMQFTRNHVGSTVFGGKIYVIGGQQEGLEGTANFAYTEAYDPATDTWSRLADLPVPRGHITSSVLNHNGMIYVIGGSVNDNKWGAATSVVHAYDPIRNVWVKMPDLPLARKSPVAGFWGNTLYSSTGDYSPLSSATTETWAGQVGGAWESLSPAPLPLGDTLTAQVGNKVYVMSGNNDQTFVYNVSTDTWEGSVASRPIPGAHQVAEVIDGKVYVVGGIQSNRGKLQIYDPSTNTWTIGANLPRPIFGVASTVIDGQLYIAGGQLSRLKVSRISPTAYRYNPQTGTWTTIASLPKGVRYAAGGTDGEHFFVFSGEGQDVVKTSGKQLDTVQGGKRQTIIRSQNRVQMYNPKTNRWSRQLTVDGINSVVKMPQPRVFLKKAVFFNNRFYLIGGQSAPNTPNQQTFDTYLSFDVQKNSWEIAGSMQNRKFGSSPIIIGSRVYLFGGGSALLNSSGEETIQSTQPVEVLNL